MEWHTMEWHTGNPPKEGYYLITYKYASGDSSYVNDVGLQYWNGYEWHKSITAWMPLPFDFAFRTTMPEPYMEDE